MADKSDAADQPVADGPAPAGVPSEAGEAADFEATDSTATVNAATVNAATPEDAAKPIGTAESAAGTRPVVGSGPVAPAAGASSATQAALSVAGQMAGQDEGVAAAAVGATAVDGPKLPGWSARAVVPGVRPLSQPMPWSDEEFVVDPYGDRSWFRPIIIGTVTVILLGMLIAGIWLIYANFRTRPVPDVSPTATTPPVSVTPSPSTSTLSEYVPTFTAPPTSAPSTPTASSPSPSSASPSPAPSRSPSPSKSLLLPLKP
jgi:hypothetical protein